MIKSIIISDIHLGSKHSKVKELLDWIRPLKFDNLFLVGDIIDIYKLERGKGKWCNECWQFIEYLGELETKGVQVVYVTGNHDSILRDKHNFLRNILERQGIEVCDEYVYNSTLLIHGDKFDIISRYGGIADNIGDILYEGLLDLNFIFYKAQTVLGIKQWSFSKAVKKNVKDVVKFLSNFEKAVTTYAKEKGCGQVICGHVHVTADKEVEGIRYMNCGDWVENCTALVEYENGKIELTKPKIVVR